MLDFSPETEAPARSVAEARKLSVDEAVREALQARGWMTLDREIDASPDTVAARVAAMEKIVAEIAALPILIRARSKRSSTTSMPYDYALAKTLGSSLLFKGDDFPHTDLTSAL